MLIRRIEGLNGLIEQSKSKQDSETKAWEDQRLLIEKQCLLQDVSAKREPSSTLASKPDATAAMTMLRQWQTEENAWIGHGVDPRIMMNRDVLCLWHLAWIVQPCDWTVDGVKGVEEELLSRCLARAAP